MSYTRSYHEVVSRVVSKTVSVSYPPSQNGGSKIINVEIDAEIPVDVNIHVDTDPFDASIEHCETNIDLLTGAVVATEAAQIYSKEQQSIKIANTIIGGFFSYISSEISQQIAELSQNIEAQLMHIRELVKSCLAKKSQMETDYNRISGRYINIFDDLNNELANRIVELDRPVFTFKKETDKLDLYAGNSDLVNTVSVFSKENSELQSKIHASVTKKNALESLNKAKLFLEQQNVLETTIQLCMLNENDAALITAPICFMEANNINNEINRSIFHSPYLGVFDGRNIINDLLDRFLLNSLNWTTPNLEFQQNISLFFHSEMNDKLNTNDNHTVRVRDTILKMVDINGINIINFAK